MDMESIVNKKTQIRVAVVWNDSVYSETLLDPSKGVILGTSKKADLCAPVGWATYNGTTNGGAGGDTVHVSTFADLKSHAESEGATVIFLTGSVGTGNGADSRIYVNSNKTILGHLGAELHGYFIIDGESNIIIRNLKLRGDGARDNGSDDVISVITGTRLWFDHLDISDGEDGNLDIKRESNYITISWCKFSYTSASTAHEFSNLIGHNDNHTADRGHSKVTLHHNYWAAGVKQRMPRTKKIRRCEHETRTDQV